MTHGHGPATPDDLRAEPGSPVADLDDGDRAVTPPNGVHRAGAADAHLGERGPDAAAPPSPEGDQAATPPHGAPTYLDPINATPVPPPAGSEWADPATRPASTTPWHAPATAPAQATPWADPTGGPASAWAGPQPAHDATRTAAWAQAQAPGQPPPAHAHAAAVPPQQWPLQQTQPPAPFAATGRGRTLVIGLVAGLLGGLLGGVIGTQLADGRGGSIGVLDSAVPEADPNAPLGAVEAVAARVLPSVVQLKVRSGDGGGEGSGMILSADGLVLTNNHVVDGATGNATLTAVFHDGRTAPADIVGRDPSSDVAVIRVRGVSGLTPIELGNSESVRVGQQVVAIGSPLGLGGSVTSGIISAVDRAVNVGPQTGATDATVLNALQTDAAINPGNSGGPLVDMKGRVVGINSAIATTGGSRSGSIGVGFSIPINQAHRIARELETTGVATRAVLGINVAVRESDAGNGAVIGQVTPGSPAEVASLLPGEVITRVDDRVITDGDELVAAIRDHVPGDQVKLTVNGREVVVTLGAKTG
jgi:putative serine protease PepD